MRPTLSPFIFILPAMANYDLNICPNAQNCGDICVSCQNIAMGQCCSAAGESGFSIEYIPNGAPLPSLNWLHSYKKTDPCRDERFDTRTVGNDCQIGRERVYAAAWGPPPALSEAQTPMAATSCRQADRWTFLGDDETYYSLAMDSEHGRNLSAIHCQARKEA